MARPHLAGSKLRFTVAHVSGEVRARTRPAVRPRRRTISNYLFLLPSRLSARGAHSSSRPSLSPVFLSTGRGLPRARAPLPHPADARMAVRALLQVPPGARPAPGPPRAHPSDSDPLARV
eukprot:31450-Pelagococcus_subviridis.AAC.11